MNDFILVHDGEKAIYLRISSIDAIYPMPLSGTHRCGLTGTGYPMGINETVDQVVDLIAAARSKTDTPLTRDAKKA